MKDYNKIFFDKINAYQGRFYILDAFARAGAEWVIIASLAWFISSIIIIYWPDRDSLLWHFIFFATAWMVAWVINISVGFFVKEPRPFVNQPFIKKLFLPLMSWKSFPSDHAMSAFLICFMTIVFGLPGAWALFALALWVAFGRLFSGIHYPIDILGGIVIAGMVAVWAKYIILIL
jgi:undecaprenyl-diphosphatase